MSTETPEETIARLTESNRRLANQIAGYVDRMQQTIAGIVKDAKAEALHDAADAMDSDPGFRDPLRLKSDWLRARADNLEAS